MQPGQLDLEFLGYTSYWNSAEKKGYSGTAIYSRHTPLSVTYGIGVEEHDHEGRVITLEMPEFFLVCVYVPNSQDGLRRLDYRMRWEDDFREYLAGLAARKGVVVCGDMNVAHNEIDIKNPDTNRRNAGFTDEERGKFSGLLDSGFTDSWRLQHPGRGEIFLVVVSLPRPREECRVAAGLFPRLRLTQGQDRSHRDPHRDPRLRPLPRRARPRSVRQGRAREQAICSRGRYIHWSRVQKWFFRSRGISFPAFRERKWAFHSHSKAVREE